MSEDRLHHTIASIQPVDLQAEALAQARQDTLTKPRGSLGRLEVLSVQLAGVTGEPLRCIKHMVIVTMAGDHGVAVEDVSAYPQEVTAQMVQNFLRGGAAINVLAKHVGARVVVVDMGVAADLPPHPELVHKKVAHGTGNIAREPAMTREQALRSIVAGIDVVETELGHGLDIVCTGDMGIGNTTPSAAIAAALTGRPVAEVVGRGTGVDDAGLARKVATVERALAVNHPNPADGLETLAKVGGFEIGGLAGVILGAAAHRRPVILDGFVSGAAAMIAVSLAPQVRPYLIAGHRSQEPGHHLMLDWLGVKPLLDLDMRLGEGTGGALGMFLAEAASKVLREMATFHGAAVSDREVR
jgi:nicotinate-nucleotide--dimethylbenzimidazole phosphoribosyltransferase